ncbi:MAG: DedA family protein [Armatimonadetes bacterium]|nr:DedA family protein [Armatimonadota bacterium]
MELANGAFTFLLHVDDHLAQLLQQYGPWVYAILFVIIFCETGLVVTPFLPGDSLLFAAGSFAALGQLNIWAMLAVLALAAIGGDTVNYWIGHYLGPKVFQYQRSRWFNPEHLTRAHAFYEKYGGKTIIIARFVPIVRTFAPFVAGVGAMTYPKFIFYNIAGGLGWVGICVGSGYLVGNLPWVRRHFEAVILIIITISLLPMVIEYLGSRRKARASASK